MTHTSVLPTGLKAVDVLAPLPRGGTILVTGEPKAGSRLLGMELAVRLTHGSAAVRQLSVFLDSAAPDASGYKQEFLASAPGSGDLFDVDHVDADRLRQRRPLDPADAGDVVIAVSGHEAFAASFLRAVETERKARGRQVLTALLVTEGPAEYGFDARLFASRLLAARALYPALDPRHSVSSALGAVSREHRGVADRVRSRIAAMLAEATADSFDDQRWTYIAAAAQRPALQALMFMSQPYFSAEAYTGLTGDYVALDAALDAFDAILAGEFAEVPPVRFQLQNGLDRGRLAAGS